jgi:hypothetical protein
MHCQLPLCQIARMRQPVTASQGCSGLRVADSAAIFSVVVAIAPLVVHVIAIFSSGATFNAKISLLATATLVCCQGLMTRIIKLSTFMLRVEFPEFHLLLLSLDACRKLGIDICRFQLLLLDDAHGRTYSNTNDVTAYAGDTLRRYYRG